MDSGQTGCAGEDQCAADVGNEADTHFGHGHFGGVGDHPDTAVRADTDTAAHHDAVHQCDDRLGVPADMPVEQVFVVPEFARFGAVAARTVVDRDDVAARAQAAVAGAADEDRLNLPVVL